MYFVVPLPTHMTPLSSHARDGWLVCYDYDSSLSRVRSCLMIGWSAGNEVAFKTTQRTDEMR
jgi:hypothetical protein